MNGPIDLSISERSSFNPMPVFLKDIAQPVSLLPGEDAAEFDAIRDAVIHEVAPQSGIEWLWTIDLIALSWDIQRYRRLRHKVLEAYRQAAVESVLQRLDLAGISQEYLQPARNHTKQNALQWRENPEAAVEIEARLASNGIDAGSINLEVFVQSRELFLTFDALMHSAQHRRIVLLREIHGRRLSSGRHSKAQRNGNPSTSLENSAL
jgi:hypothetical protein